MKDNDKNGGKAGKKQSSGSDKDGGEKSSQSEADLALQSLLNTCVETMLDKAASSDVRNTALEKVSSSIRESCGSMTGVPKPLKYMKSCYSDIVELSGEVRGVDGLMGGIDDVVSVLSMTMCEPGKTTVLEYKLKGDMREVGYWGYEYVRCLTRDIGKVWKQWDEQLDNCEMDKSNKPEVEKLIDDIVKYYLTSNSSSAAIDLLIETNTLTNKFPTDLDVDYDRVVRYIIKTSEYLVDEERRGCLGVAKSICWERGDVVTYLRVAIRNRDFDMALDIDAVVDEEDGGVVDDCYKAINNCKDANVFMQVSAILGRCKIYVDLESDSFAPSDGMHKPTDDEVELAQQLINNEKISEFFVNLSRDLDVVEAKLPEDIYKSHLSETGGFTRSSSKVRVDSARGNLCDTFVNSFVNAGFGNDKLMTIENSDWLYKNKEHGMLSAAASLGMIMMWNVEEGLTTIDKYLYSDDVMVKSGACLALGVLCNGVKNDADPAFALLNEHAEGKDGEMRRASLQGLGISYCGTGRSDVAETLVDALENSGDFQAACAAGLSLGMVYVKGTKGSDDVAMSIVQKLMECTDEEQKHTHYKFLVLGLGLMWFGKGSSSDATIEALKTIENEKSMKFCCNVVTSCAYAGTGNVLKVQELLHECAEHLTEDAMHQSVAALGIALVTVGEPVGEEMTLRVADHLLQYTELPIKRVVPLMLAALHVGDPDFSIVDTLSRLSHHEDDELSMNAIMAMGLISSGTNNSRVAGLLRNLGDFYAKEPGHMFVVRISQGLLHMGKGLMTLNPFFSDRTLLDGNAFAGILSVLFACLDLKGTILDKSHQIIFNLSTAMNPRMLITVDKELNWVPVTVRVGQAVETVGAAGKPKTITGFQTHQTPVLLTVKERAELANDEQVAMTNVLEGVVVVEKNEEEEGGKGIDL